MTVKTTLLAILLAVLLQTTTSTQISQKDVFCVRTHREQSCPTTSAAHHLFVEDLHDYQHLFASETTVHFMEGKHIVNGSGNVTGMLSLANLEDFTLEGPAVPHSKPPAATVRCTRPFHFLFTNMTRLVIRNIKFINCSALNSTPYLNSDSVWKHATASLMMLTTYDSVLYNVHITESCGYGLFCYNSLGVSISYCKFQNNSDNAEIKRSGGNVLMAYINIGLVTIEKQSKQHRLEILNCNFTFGRNHRGSGGLEVISDSDNSDIESNITIRIASSQFYNNSGKYGANLQITDEGLHSSITLIEIDSCSFHNGNSQKEGGSFRCTRFIYHSPNQKRLLITLLNSTFKDNLAGFDGGAIHADSKRTFYPEQTSVIIGIINCTFSHNKALHEGGVISSKYALLNIISCTFENNTAVKKGGGAISIKSASLFATNCSFDSNTAVKRDGGAISIESASLFATNCSFDSNTALGNGGHINSVNIISLSLVNCSLKKGYSSTGNGGGIYMYFSNQRSILQILNCTFLNNTARSGGALGLKLIFGLQQILLPFRRSLEQFLVNITDCHFVENQATHGGGMYMLLILRRWDVFLMEICIQQSWFIRNSADSGGGLEAHFLLSIEQESTVKTTVNTTHFIGNVARDEGSAINLLGCGQCLDGESLDCKQLLSHTVVLTYGLFIQNRVCQLTNKASTINTNVMSIRLESTDFISNIGSGILASNAKITTNGENTFKDNIAIVGGALHLDCYPTSLLPIESHHSGRCMGENKLQSPNIIISEGSLITMRNNTAIQFGGAIAVNEQCAQQSWESDVPPCSFRAAQTVNNSHGGKVLLNSNKAMIVGNEMYGGPMLECIYDEDPSIDPVKKFTSTFIMENQTLTSQDIMADPFRICFCIENAFIQGPYCPRTTTVMVFRGQQFNITAIPVTALTDNSSTKLVTAKIHPEQSTGRLGWLQRAQEINRTCDILTYSIRTAESHEELHLILTEEPTSKTSIIHVYFLPCPFGFAVTGEPPQCDCAKHLTVRVPQLTCDINSITVLLPSRAWIGNFSHGLVAHLNCPYDYCNDNSREVKLEGQDAQCSHGRSGVLCGSCRPGLSLALGSSTCLHCSNVYLLLLLPFTAAGVALVAVLQKGDLTVSKGFLNGFIFYANIIQGNKAIFFPPNPKTTFTKIITALIAWMNLDLGIETCFADGLNAMAKAWLQFVFPVYVWIIVGAIIYSSRYSVTISKLTGSNTVPVLATLFLLSYTKLLRTIIVAVSPITITDESGTSHLRWIADANVAFLRGAHIPLFLVALFMMVTYIVPLTAVVTLAPCLQARTRHPLLRWVVRIKPLLDAYTGPYRDKHRYWTGFMLLTRVALFIVFAANSTGDSRFNLLAINIVTAGVLVLQKIVGKLYRRTINGTFEVLHLLNLLIISTTTLFLQGRHFHPMAQEIVACITVSFSLLLFTVTACWQAWKNIKARVNAQKKLAGILARLSLRKHREPPKETEEIGDEPQQATRTPPTRTILDMRELREPLLTND